MMFLFQADHLKLDLSSLPYCKFRIHTNMNFAICAGTSLQVNGNLLIAESVSIVKGLLRKTYSRWQQGKHMSSH